MRNLTCLVLLASLLAVLLKRTTSSTLEHTLGDKDAEFLQLLKRAKHLSKRTDSSSASCDSCTVPEVDNVSVIKVSSGTKLLLNSDRKKLTAHTKCAPHETLVRLPSTWVAPTLPFVSLHRCQGSDSYLTSLGYRCKVKSKEAVRVQYQDIYQGLQLSEAVMYNHTDCSFECQKRTCGPNMKFEMHYCDCICMISAADCGPKQLFDAHSCACKCKLPIDCSFSIYKRFSHKTCQCECDQRIKDICTENNLDMDATYCKCKSKSTNAVPT